MYMVVQIAYTNSNCQDLWEVFIKENKKYTQVPLYMISDKKPENYGYEDVYVYNNTDHYFQVWINAVEKFNSKYFIYLQEDFILYDTVNEKKINEYLEFLENNPQYSFVRLLKSGNLNNKQLKPTLYEIEPTNVNIFAMQATIWRSFDYVKLMNAVRDSKWLETNVYRDKMIALNMQGVYHYDNEEKAGNQHYNTSVYPYIATALVRGKWNIGEYKNQLNKIFQEYNIDVNKRGIWEK